MDMYIVTYQGSLLKFIADATAGGNCLAVSSRKDVREAFHAAKVWRSVTDVAAHLAAAE